MLLDRFGRAHDDLRLAVTDRCNLRCTYCMPVEPVWLPRDDLLSFEEIAHLTRIFVSLGVRRVRITGGEPLLRSDLPALVTMLAAIEGVQDLSLTTNGLLLKRLAMPLARAGLGRVNVSLDTLDPKRFEALTRHDALAQVLDGIEAAVRAGLCPVKINAVLLRGINDDEAEPLVVFGRERGIEVRFIEFMPVENGGTWSPSRVVTGEDLRRRIAARWPLHPDPAADPCAPARRFLFGDGRGAVGFINSVTEPFCEACSRLRLTADGKLTACLYAMEEADLKSLFRAGAADPLIAGQIREAVRGKGRGGALEILDRRAALPLSRTMHQIGG